MQHYFVVKSFLSLKRDQGSCDLSISTYISKHFHVFNNNLIETTIFEQQNCNVFTYSCNQPDKDSVVCSMPAKCSQLSHL